MKVDKKSLIILVALLTGGNAQGITLQQAVLAASTYDSELAAAANLHDAESQKRIQGFSGLLPEISLSGNYYKQDQPDASYAAGVKRHSYTLNMTQPIFDLAKYATWRRADASADLADITYMSAQQKLIQDVSNAWFTVIYSRKQLATLQQEKRAYEIQLNKVKTALQVGDGTQLDIDEAQANFDRAIAEMLSAENELNNAHINFSRMTGLPAEDIREDNMQCLFRSSNESLQSALERAVQKNLNIVAARHQLEEARSDIIATSAAHLPVVSLQASYGGNWSRGENENVWDSIFGTTNKTKNTYVGVNVSIPIFAGGRQLSQSFESLSRRDQALQLLEDARRKTIQNTQMSWLGVKNGLEKINAYKRASESAKKKLASTIFGKEVGLRTLVDQFSAERDLFKSMQELTEAENNFLKQKIILAASTGDLDYSTLDTYVCH
ncbi:TolC family outer membrane protein [Erwinia oleae]|uniref:TolC family outer membrane protein n=1 Tax=Erwinia oleae TaxID=796334 RepID=UPI00054DE4D8|nr:TolC family outer membrane protein [Erwinia oleae]